MKSLAMKSLAMLVSLSLLLSSCRGYIDITKDKPVTRDFLSSLKPGKYQFELKTGLMQYVEITVVGANSIAGFMPNDNDVWGKVSYSESFDTIEKNVAKISHYEYDKKSTIAGIVTIAVIQGIIFLGLLFSEINDTANSG